MQTTIGNRIKDLRNHYNLGVKEFALRCGLSHVAIFHFENGKTFKPHKASLNRIITAYGTSVEWLVYGQGEMLPNGNKELNFFENQPTSLWKDEAYRELKNKNELLEKEVERLWGIVEHFTNGSIQEMAKAS